MKEFERAYAQLNAEQKKAVNCIDGPVLVIAGPGTGKTQLLATRVGRILEASDALPQNILCLTFTEAGVIAMRERLTKFLGAEAYGVQISTYHSFGSDLLRRYPEYAASYDHEPIDELGSDSLIREILSAASYSNPLKSSDNYAADLRSLMSECKRALITPKNLKNIAQSNLEFIAKASQQVTEVLKDFKAIDKTSAGFFDKLQQRLQAIPSKSVPNQTNLKQACLETLADSLQLTTDSGSTKPLTAWKNAWLARGEQGQFVLAGETINQKLLAAAEIFDIYQKLLAKRKLFDYDDMILRAIATLEKHPDFKFSLAEQYQYILLDEFQDTNPAQFKLVELLTDNPVNEGRPNVMAVGDDDQAIYAFQGADHANMYRFSVIYRDVRIISLRSNYRSSAEILDIAYHLGGQISERLHTSFPGVSKILKASSAGQTKPAAITHHEFVSDAAQYAWVAQEIKKLATKEHLPLDEIAVLAPKHRYLIPLLPYLASQRLPLRYEKRENILDKPVLIQLEQMSRLVIALGQQNRGLIDALWSEVLSYDFWKLPTEKIWNLSWAVNASRGDWTTALLADTSTKQIATFFLRLKDLLSTTTLEQQLDLLTGVTKSDAKAYKLPMRSPLFEHYFGKDKPKDSKYLEVLNDLSVLRGRLRASSRNSSRPFSLRDFTDLVDAHRASGINILNTSPHYEAKQAVNVMSAYQAKGREFTAVFVLAAQDQVWGSASRTASSNIPLPANLSHIRYRGGSDDERLRLLYVAITRAKTHLYLTSYGSSVDGQATRPLKYLIGQTSLSPIAAVTQVMPLKASDMQNYWHLRHIPPFTPKLIDLLEPTLDKYQLSPTHLNQFTDVTSGGPEQFFLNSILRFPKGQSPSAAFGTAIHETLNWFHQQRQKHSRSPLKRQALKFFEVRLQSQRLSDQDQQLLLERGQDCLTAFLNTAASYSGAQDQSEVNFKHEGVFAGAAHLSGKIDRLLIDKKAKAVTVVDFKTGKPAPTWRPGTPKLHKYRQQLLMYKLLVEGSHSYSGYKVRSGLLVFVEPNVSGQITTLELAFEDGELESLSQLIQAVWVHIKTLDFPDTEKYPPTYAGIVQFEQDLIK